MGNFSRDDTFDRMKHYVGVRLQQGVPIVDADWNEMEDIGKYELRAFLKWFVGNGVPQDNHGFRIEDITNKIILTSQNSDHGLSSVTINLELSRATSVLGFGSHNSHASRFAPPAAQLTGDVSSDSFVFEEGMQLVVSVDGLPEETVTFSAGSLSAGEVAQHISAIPNLVASVGAHDDFDIRGGDGTPDRAGRCLVEGWDVINESNLKYTAQPLYENAALADAWGVPPLEKLEPPRDGTDRTDVVYLDVWERQVDSTEDYEHLVHPDINIETCVRLKREWVVRVDRATDGTKLPDPPSGHVYYALATITRENGDGTIHASDITDLRERRLLLPPATLITDLFGTSPADYRRGLGRPPISFRQAINALLRGEVPATPETAIAPDPNSDDRISRGTFFDAENGLITVWSSDRVGGVRQVFAARLSLDDPDGGFGTPQQITTGTVHTIPHALLLDSGEVLVIYQSGETWDGINGIYLKHAAFRDLNTSVLEIEVATRGGISRQTESAPFAVVVDEQVLILWFDGEWNVNRFDPATNTFPPGDPNILPIPEGANVDTAELHAAKDAANSVWIAFALHPDPSQVHHMIRVLEMPLTGAPMHEAVLEPPGVYGGGICFDPFVAVDNDDNVWVFWGMRDGSIWYSRFLRTPGTWEEPTEVPGTNRGLRPVAVADAEGHIWLFWESGRSGSRDIWSSRLSPVTGDWEEPRRITCVPEDDTNPFNLRGVNGMLWLFWNRQLGPNKELFYRRLITSI